MLKCWNVDGVRIGKVVIYNERDTDLIHYLYDLTGVIGLEYNNSTYLFKKNLQSYVLEMVGINNLKSF